VQQQQQQLLLKEAWREIVVGEDEYCNLLEANLEWKNMKFRSTKVLVVQL
jgi:hypothetical protein